eukprot:4052638-Amphidinium_carterae.1
MSRRSNPPRSEYIANFETTQVGKSCINGMCPLRAFAGQYFCNFAVPREGRNDVDLPEPIKPLMHDEGV